MADGRVKVSEVLVGAQPVERFQRALDAAATGSASLGLSVWIEVGAGLVALIVAGLPVLMWRGIFHREVRSW
jgi:hypothetical protein